MCDHDTPENGSAVFITLHDTYGATKRKPNGRPIRVRPSSIDSLRGYAEGLTRTIVTVRGVHHHVAETEEEVLALIGGRVVPHAGR